MWTENLQKNTSKIPTPDYLPTSKILKKNLFPFLQRVNLRVSPKLNKENVSYHFIRNLFKKGSHL